MHRFLWLQARRLLNFPRRFLWDHRLDLRINLLNCGRVQPRCGPFGSGCFAAQRTLKITTLPNFLARNASPSQDRFSLRLEKEPVAQGLEGSTLKQGVKCHCEKRSDEAIPLVRAISQSRLLRFARNDKKENFGVPRPPHEHG